MRIGFVGISVPGHFNPMTALARAGTIILACEEDEQLKQESILGGFKWQGSFFSAVSCSFS
jgi:hypothetical protein